MRYEQLLPIIALYRKHYIREVFDYLRSILADSREVYKQRGKRIIVSSGKNKAFPQVFVYQRLGELVLNQCCRLLVITHCGTESYKTGVASLTSLELL